MAPGLHQTGPVAHGFRCDLGAPAVGARGELTHRGARAGPAALVAQDDFGAEHIPALAEGWRCVAEGLPDDRLRGAQAVLDDRLDVHDRDQADRVTAMGRMCLHCFASAVLAPCPLGSELHENPRHHGPPQRRLPTARPASRPGGSWES